VPERIQLRRTKGWRIPPGAVSVARPGRWGNPFRVGDNLEFPFSEMFGPAVRDRAHAVLIFAAYAQITCGYALLVRRELAGKSLACWCPLDDWCHRSVLMAIADGQNPGDVLRDLMEQMGVVRA
jgi:hypothetical protein